MKNLLLLDNRYTPDTSDIWRAAIRRGFATIRTDILRVKDHVIGDYGLIRYYGNTLHAEMIKNYLPFEFIPLNEKNRWLTTIPELTKRKIEVIRFGALTQPLKQKIFTKPVGDKWFEGKVYNEGDSIIGGMNDDDLIYVSEPIEMIDEVRCFVLNDKVLTASYYRIDKIFNPTEVSKDMIENLFNDLVKQVRAKVDLPPGIVLDFARINNDEWCFIEANESWASGLYLCDPDACLDVVLASQRDKLTT